MGARASTSARVQRVLMTSDAVGGVWTYSVELCRGLREYDVEVHVASMGPSPTPAQRAELVSAGATFHESNYALEWMDEPWREVDMAGRWLSALAREIRPDLVHLNGYCHAALPFEAPVCVVAHSCVLSWWAAVFGERAPERYDEYRRRVSAGLRAAACVVGPSFALLDALRSCYGELRRTRVIPNGIAALPPSTGRREKANLIFACGRIWDRAKNLECVAESARDLAWPVRIAGSQAETSGASIERSGARLLGPLTPLEVRAELERAAIFVHPALYEPFGLAPLEAARHGCALVLGDIPSLREVWSDAAIYVAPTDRTALADSLKALIDSPDAVAELGARARTRAAEYTDERMAFAYRSLYEELSQWTKTSGRCRAPAAAGAALSGEGAG